MLEKFRKHIAGNFPFLNKKRLLLAVSGGLDSMVLADLFLKLGQDISIAHCNFKLREQESDADENFVKSYAAGNGIRFYSMRFDTKKFAADEKLSIQVAARELRYAWFNEILEANGFDFVLTAHHADDNLETFLINLSRAAGLDGLTGIPEQNGKIVRPLLIFSRDELSAYAEANSIAWREDSSNSSDKYLRNYIRHEIVPKIKALNSDFMASFASTIGHLKQSKSLVEDASLLVYKQVAIEKKDKIIFKIFELKRLPNFEAYLYHWLKDFGFTAWNDIYKLAEAQSGKQIFAPNFTLLKDREVLILIPRKVEQDDKSHFIERGITQVDVPINLTFSMTSDISQPSDNRIFVDADKLQFPLEVRRWREGDVFRPFGMSGSKKVSKYFKDEKLALSDKADVWMLCSLGKIVWIIGRRMDDQFKVTDATKNILQITTP